MWNDARAEPIRETERRTDKKSAFIYEIRKIRTRQEKNRRIERVKQLEEYAANSSHKSHYILYIRKLIDWRWNNPECVIEGE